MAEHPTKKEKKINESNIPGLTHKNIKWYETHELTGKKQEFLTIKISYTDVIKSWAYEGTILSEKYLVPLGKVKTISLWSKKKKLIWVIISFLPQ